MKHFCIIVLMGGMSLWTHAANAFDLSVQPIQPLQALNTNSEKAALGEKLFFDARLSQDNSISCAHCHDLKAMGGADHLKRSFGVEGREGAVNSPTVFNAALYLAQFWDGRALTLEDQIDGPLNNHMEMASNWPEVVSKLSADPQYQTAFKALYSDGIGAANIKNAIAEFERTLITTNSRFDRFLRGDQQAITKAEKHGYAVFKSYGCVACHQGRAVGGNLFQKMGIMRDYFTADSEFDDADRGRFNVTGNVEDMHYFKVPSLRLAVLTAPYFHDGSQETLVDAIRTMAQYQLGRSIPDHDLRAIITFLYTLPGQYRGHNLEPDDRRHLQPLSDNMGSGR